MSARLEVRGLSAGYGARRVLCGIDLEVHGGEIVGVLGANGSGKTTLLRCIAGTVDPSAGDVRIDGRPAAAMRAPELARCLAVVPQEYRLPAGFAVCELVAMGRSAHLGYFGRASAKDEEIVDDALAVLGLDHLGDRPVEQLSGGERQMVMLAMALAQQTGLLLLDEPTAHLDIGYQTRIMEAIRDVSRRDGRATVAVLHDLGLAGRHCDRVVVLRGGVVLASGPPGEILSAELLRECYGVAPVFFAPSAAGGTEVVN